MNMYQKSEEPDVYRKRLQEYLHKYHRDDWTEEDGNKSAEDFAIKLLQKSTSQQQRIQELEEENKTLSFAIEQDIKGRMVYLEASLTAHRELLGKVKESIKISENNNGRRYVTDNILHLIKDFEALTAITDFEANKEKGKIN